MPIYEYKCRECGDIQEKLTFDMEQIEAKCVECGGKAVKIMSAGSFRGQDRWRKPSWSPK